MFIFTCPRCGRRDTFVYTVPVPAGTDLGVCCLFCRVRKTQERVTDVV